MANINIPKQSRSSSRRKSKKERIINAAKQSLQSGIPFQYHTRILHKTQALERKAKKLWQEGIKLHHEACIIYSQKPTSLEYQETRQKAKDNIKRAEDLLIHIVEISKDPLNSSSFPTPLIYEELKTKLFKP